MKRLIQKYFGSIEWLIIALFLMGLPFIFTKKLLDPVLYSRYLYLSILLVVLSIIVGYRIVRGQFQFYFSKTDKLIFGAGLLFVVMHVLSSFDVINLKEAIFHAIREAALIYLFFLFYQLIRANPKGKDVLVKSIVVLTFLYLLIAISQLIEADFTRFKEATNYYGYYFRQAIGHVKSTLASINPFASFLVLSLPFSIYSIFFYNKFWKIFSSIVAGLALFFIFILASKASWGSLGLASLVIVLCLYIYLFVLMPRETSKKLPAYVKVAILLLPFVVVGSGIYFIQKTDIKVVKIVTEKVQQVLSPELCLENIYSTDNPTSTQTRTLVWANTIQMFRDNPLLGVGPGQWRIEYAKYGVDGFEHDIRNGSKHFQRPHNDFLWILGETGFLGLFFYLVIYIGVLVLAFRLFYKGENLKSRILGMLAFSFLIGFILNLFVSFPRERVSHNLIYLILFALVLNETNKEHNQWWICRKLHLKIGVVVLLLAISMVNLWAANQIFRGEKAARAVKFGISRKNYQIVLRASKSVKETLYTMDAFAVPMSYYEGIAHSKFKNMEDAKLAFDQAYKTHPYHLQVLNNLGTSFDLTGNKQAALKYYNQALSISPRYKEALINSAIVYYNLNDFEKSFENILKVPAKERNNPEKFRQTMLTICKRKAILVAHACDTEKLKSWINDENKIEATFVTIQKTKQEFNKVLLEELGK